MLRIVIDDEEGDVQVFGSEEEGIVIVGKPEGGVWAVL